MNAVPLSVSIVNFYLDKIELISFPDKLLPFSAMRGPTRDIKRSVKWTEKYSINLSLFRKLSINFVTKSVYLNEPSVEKL